MKKNIYFFLLVTVLLSGCSNSGSTNNSESNDNQNYLIKNDVTIDFLCMVDKAYREDLQKMVDGFSSVEPHVKVNLSNPLGSGNYTMLEKSVVAGFFKGQYPDLVQCYPDNVVKYINRGYALKLDDYLDNVEYGVIKDGQSMYIQSLLDEGSSYTVEGTYSLPFCKSTELLYYNKEALIGLDLHEIDSTINNGKALDAEYLDNLTWEELFNKLCPAIKQYNDALPEADKLIVPSDTSAIFTYDSDENFFITLANQYGYGYTSVDSEGNANIDFDNPEMINLVKWLKTAKQNGYLQTKGTNNGNYVSYLFQQQKALFTVSSTAGLSYNFPENDTFSVGVAKIPHAAGKEYTSINQGPSICLLNHSDDDRSLASFLLWKYITNEVNGLEWTKITNYMVIRDDVYQSQEYLSLLETNGQSSQREVANANNLKKISDVRGNTFNTPVFKGSSNARTNVGRLLIDCLNSDDIDSEINNLFKSYSDEAKEHLG